VWHYYDQPLDQAARDPSSSGDTEAAAMEAGAPGVNASLSVISFGLCYVKWASGDVTSTFVTLTLTDASVESEVTGGNSFVTSLLWLTFELKVILLKQLPPKL
jgi:hypothetical protein